MEVHSPRAAISRPSKSSMSLLTHTLSSLRLWSYVVIIWVCSSRPCSSRPCFSCRALSNLDYKEEMVSSRPASTNLCWCRSFTGSLRSPSYHSQWPWSRLHLVAKRRRSHRFSYLWAWENSHLAPSRPLEEMPASSRLQTSGDPDILEVSSAPEGWREEEESWREEGEGWREEEEGKGKGWEIEGEKRFRW